MEFVLRIKTENEAFAQDMRGEVSRILRSFALTFETDYRGAGESFPLRDSNGNRCGSVEWNEISEEGKPQIANARVASALGSLLQYNWKAELQDFINEGCPEGHIFLEMVELDQWLFNHTTTAEEFAKE